jgi:16S rRNA (guanine966-N2)-methyltransferase
MVPPAPFSSASGRLRIIGGSLRGSKLNVADLPGLRPTPDRVRETLFNWLMPVIDGARCLDLFAGTGALGIEALSRGAAEVDFIERDPRLARDLRDNLARLHQSARVREGDALAMLNGAAEKHYDLVFVDPPFDANLWAGACAVLEVHQWLAANALIYVESPTSATYAVPPTWQLHREGKAGAVRYALFRRSIKLGAG